MGPIYSHCVLAHYFARCDWRMTEDQPIGLAPLKEIQIQLKELLFSALMLAVGVNVLATAIVLSVSNNIGLIWSLAITSILLGLFGIAKRLLRSFDDTRVLSGVLFIEEGTRQPISVDRYDSMEDFRRNIIGLTSENKAFYKTWYDDGFVNHKKTDDGG